MIINTHTKEELDALPPAARAAIWDKEAHDLLLYAASLMRQADSLRHNRHREYAEGRVTDAADWLARCM